MDGHDLLNDAEKIDYPNREGGKKQNLNHCIQKSIPVELNCQER